MTILKPLRWAFRPTHHCEEAALYLLNLLEVTVTSTSLQRDLTTYSNYSSPLSISDVFKTYGLASVSLKIERANWKGTIEEPFDKDVKADLLLSELTSNKMVIHPYISVQKDFGYSDATAVRNSISGLLTNLFTNAQKRLLLFNKIIFLFPPSTIKIT